VGRGVLLFVAVSRCSREAVRVPREVVSRAYYDKVTGDMMLLRAVVEETESEIAVVTLYKTSKIKKYLHEGPT
jgi:hypothetical protein